VGGPPGGYQWRVLADPNGLALAGFACLLWDWKTAYNRHRRWCADGSWAVILNELRRGCDHGEQDWTLAVDSSVVRAHQHAAGARRLPPADLDTGGSVELQEFGG
jgi:transposase